MGNTKLCMFLKCLLDCFFWGTEQRSHFSVFCTNCILVTKNLTSIWPANYFDMYKGKKKTTHSWKSDPDTEAAKEWQKTRRKQSVEWLSLQEDGEATKWARVTRVTTLLSFVHHRDFPPVIFVLAFSCLNKYQNNILKLISSKINVFVSMSEDFEHIFWASSWQNNARFKGFFSSSSQCKGSEILESYRSNK